MSQSSLSRSKHGQSEKTNEQPINLTMVISSLSACAFVSHYSNMSMSPYAGYMVMSLVKNTTEDTVGAYTGFLVGSFMVGNVLMSFAWGKAADVYGRKFVLVSSILLKGCFTLLFGTAQSFHMAILYRFLSGMSNGTYTAVKTIAHEVSPENEKKTMGVVMGIRSWAMLVSPLIGGFLAEPIKRYPSWEINNVCIRSTLEKCPFLLPNVFGALCAVVAAGLVIYTVPETLSPDQRRRVIDIPRSLYRNIESICHTGTHEERLPILHGSGDATSSAKAAIKESTGASAVWSNDAVRSHIVIQWFYTFLEVTCGGLFPLFCISVSGGLGLQEASIGTIMSAAGLLYALLQYVVYSAVDDKFGMYNGIFIGGLASIQLRLLIPVSLLMPENSLVTPLWLATVNGLSQVAYSLCMITNSRALNRAVPSRLRGTMNGLATTGGSALRSMAPFFAGMFSTFAYSSLGPGGGKYGSLLIYGTTSVLGLCVSWRIWTVTRASIARANEARNNTESFH